MPTNTVNFVKIAWIGKHFGEEPPLVGKRGAGAIFFSGCNLRCVYCQNYQISQQNLGEKYSIDELVAAMLKLQKNGALNIDLVTPTIWLKQIRQAIIKAKEKGLKIPIIWNSNAYENAEDIKTLKGLVDVYLPDFKYGDENLAFRYSGAKNYVEKAKKTIKEMLAQVGNPKLSKDTAKSGIFVRHLILPGQIKNSFRVLEILADLGPGLCLSLMTQYRPVYRAKEFPEINRNIRKEEFKKVFNYSLRLGFKNGWTQKMNNQTGFLPDFTKRNPFSKRVCQNANKRDF